MRTVFYWYWAQLVSPTGKVFGYHSSVWRSNSLRPNLRRGVQKLSVIGDNVIEAAPLEVSSYYPELSASSRKYLEDEGIYIASPIQAACWSMQIEESVCLHSPTGSGKTLGMMLPALKSAELLASNKSDKVIVILAPSREVVGQHAAVARGLLGSQSGVVEITTATTGDEVNIERSALKVMEAKVIVATPREFANVFEHEPSLYGSLPERVSVLIADEVDQLMPARKYKGDRVTRWQDQGRHPAEAIVKLFARRGDLRQVLAGSATLDKVAKTKLESQLKRSSSSSSSGHQKSIKLPLRVLSTTQLAFSPETVLVDNDELKSDEEQKYDEEIIVSTEKNAGTVSLTTKTRIRDAVRPTVRTTLVPSHIRHCCLKLPRGANDEIFVETLRKCINSRRPRAALILICSASGLKLRQLDAKIRTTGEPRYRPLVLTDILFPSSSRAKKRRAHRNEKGLKQRIAKSSKTELAASLTQATRDKPCLVLADQAIARGLHLDGLDTVFVLGQPANADTYLHLAGRTGRDLIRKSSPQTSQEASTSDTDLTPTVITIADAKALKTLRSWLSTISTTELQDFELLPPPPRSIPAPIESGKSTG